MPGRQTVEEAVFRPGEATAALGNDKPAMRIGDDVHPRRRRHEVAADPHEVVAVRDEAAEAIVEGERERVVVSGPGVWFHGRARLQPSRQRVQIVRLDLGVRTTFDNAAERAPVALYVHPRGRAQHKQLVRTELIATPDEHAAGLIHPGVDRGEHRLHAVSYTHLT